MAKKYLVNSKKCTHCNGAGIEFIHHPSRGTAAGGELCLRCDGRGFIYIQGTSNKYKERK